MRTRTCLLLLSVLSGAPAAVAQTPPPRLEVTRWELSHGRWDNLRKVGIQTPSNPGGAVVPGITPGVLPFLPRAGAPTETILEALNGNPQVSLDRDGDGKPDDAAANNLIAAGVNIPAGFTLVVAENVDPALPFGWQIPRPRFGGGNYYATVSVGGVVAGQELVTPEDFKAYRATSVLYEAPDVGTAAHVQDNELDGGTKNVVALRDLDKTSTGVLSRLIGYADPMAVEIVELQQCRCEYGVCITVQANLDNNFTPPAGVVFRWAVEGQTGTLIEDVAGDNVFTFSVPVESPTGADGLPTLAPDTSVKVSVVASPLQPGGVSPFVNGVGSRPGQSVGLETFVSRAETLSDTETIHVQPSSLQRSIVFLLDASGSMKDDNRMEQAKNSAMRQLSRLSSNTEVALIVFYDCGRIVVEHDFTTNPGEITAILPGIQPSGSTPLAAAIRYAKDYLRTHACGKELDLILLSDGKETCNGDPVAEAGR